MKANARRFPTDRTFAIFSDILHGEGARAALAYVLSLSDYRFIGVFGFQNQCATSLIHYDRENPSIRQAGEVGEHDTYCSFVRDQVGEFSTVDALADKRLISHVARQAVRAYFGFPILDPDGRVLASFCHYDVVPRDPGQLDVELLVRVAGSLRQGNHIPAYPRAAKGRSARS